MEIYAMLPRDLQKLVNNYLIVREARVMEMHMVVRRGYDSVVEEFMSGDIIDDLGRRIHTMFLKDIHPLKPYWTYSPRLSGYLAEDDIEYLTQHKKHFTDVMTQFGNQIISGEFGYLIDHIRSHKLYFIDVQKAFHDRVMAGKNEFHIGCLRINQMNMIE